MDAHLGKDSFHNCYKKGVEFLLIEILLKLLLVFAGRHRFGDAEEIKMTEKILCVCLRKVRLEQNVKVNLIIRFISILYG